MRSAPLLSTTLAACGDDSKIGSTSADSDRDGSTAAVDRDDAGADVNPTTPERCDGLADDDDPSVAPTVWALTHGRAGVMTGWEHPGGEPGPDPSVSLFPFDVVLRETGALLDGTHPATRKRVALLAAVQGVMPL